MLQKIQRYKKKKSSVDQQSKPVSKESTTRNRKKKIHSSELHLLSVNFLVPAV
jgi:hypothetical protein